MKVVFVAVGTHGENVYMSEESRANFGPENFELSNIPVELLST